MKRRQLIVAVSLLLSLQLPFASATSAQETPAVRPGPLETERQAIAKQIESAEKNGIGTAAYKKVFQSIEDAIAGGAAEQDVKPRVASLKRSLDDQITRQRSLKTQQPVAPTAGTGAGNASGSICFDGYYVHRGLSPAIAPSGVDPKSFEKGLMLTRFYPSGEVVSACLLPLQNSEVELCHAVAGWLNTSAESSKKGKYSLSGNHIKYTINEVDYSGTITATSMTVNGLPFHFVRDYR